MSILVGIVILLTIFLIYVVLGYRDKIILLEERASDFITVEEIDVILKNKNKTVQEVHDEYMKKYGLLD